MGGPTRSSGVGAGAVTSAASAPSVIPNVSVPLYHQGRINQVPPVVREAVTQPLAYPPYPLASLGSDQSWFAVGGDLCMLLHLPVFLLPLFCFLFLVLFPLLCLILPLPLLFLFLLRLFLLPLLLVLLLILPLPLFLVLFLFPPPFLLPGVPLCLRFCLFCTFCFCFFAWLSFLCFSFS